jgi:dethiobiotin synthetase
VWQVGVVIVTGTGTGVGKTVTTAAVAACASGDVAVVKLAQTGASPDAVGDTGRIAQLARLDQIHEFARYPDALPPHQAAMLGGRPPLALADAVRRIVDLDALHDLVLVEGVGGLLVAYDAYDRWTLVDLAFAVDAQFLVVVGVGADMISDAALVTTTLEEQSLRVAGIVVGSWPADPGPAARYGLFDLQAMAPKRELAGVLPTGLGTGVGFRKRAGAALSRRWGGTLDTRAFVSGQRP